MLELLTVVILLIAIYLIYKYPFKENFPHPEQVRSDPSHDFNFARFPYYTGTYT